MGYPSFGQSGVWHQQLDEYALASAVARCQELLTVLDHEHTNEQMHERARAVRVEIQAMAALLPAVGLPQVPPLAKPSGEQDQLPL